MIAKRPTDKLRKAGIPDIVVQKGMYGFYLHDPRIKKQSALVYRFSGDCVAAALRGERPKVVLDEPA